MSLLRRLDLPPVWLALFAAVGALWARSVDVAPLGGAWVDLGRLLIAAGVGLAAWAAVYFWRAGTPIEPRHTPRALITEGPYRLTRNPIYRGLLLILTGWLLTEGEATGLALVPLYARILWVRFVLPEEFIARQIFGAAYDLWAARTRWRL